MKNEHKSSCKMCDAEFSNTLDLEWHMETEHGEADLIKCLVCGFNCKTQQELEIHIVLKHAFPCDKCDAQVFQSPELLKNHQITYHEEKNPYKSKDKISGNADLQPVMIIVRRVITFTNYLEVPASQVHSRCANA